MYSSCHWCTSCNINKSVKTDQLLETLISLVTGAICKCQIVVNVSEFYTHFLICLMYQCAVTRNLCIIHHHHWLNSPTWALAFLRSFCQLSFSIAMLSQFFTPKVLISWITSSSYLSLGLPVFLIPISLVLNTLLTVLLLSVRVTYILPSPICLF
jgi:hypothetical protein